MTLEDQIANLETAVGEDLSSLGIKVSRLADRIAELESSLRSQGYRLDDLERALDDVRRELRR